MGQVIDLRTTSCIQRGHKKRRDAPPGRPTNAAVRSREYLLPDEVGALVDAAGKHGRHRVRDRLLLLAMYRHGLRVSEAIDLEWSQVDFKNAELHVRRLKNGTPSVHPIKGDELRLLRRVKREYSSNFVFTSERGAPLSVKRQIGRTSSGLSFRAVH